MQRCPTSSRQRWASHAQPNLRNSSCFLHGMDYRHERREIVKRYSVVFWLAVLCLSASLVVNAEDHEVKPGSTAYLDARYGFRDVKFGTTLEDLGFRRGWNCYEEVGAYLAFCSRSDKENLTLGVAELLHIDYIFTPQDKLMAVMLHISGIGPRGNKYGISAEGKRNGAAALAVLKEAYGKGKACGVGKVCWEGKRAFARYVEGIHGRSGFFEEAPGPMIRIMVWSNELVRQFKEYKKEMERLRQQRERKKTKQDAGNL